MNNEQSYEQNQNMPKSTIQVSICYYIDDDGKKIYDLEHMQNEFTQKLKKLTKEEQEAWEKEYLKEQQSKPQGLLSNCCGASAKGGEDYEICSECGEHCEYNDEENEYPGE